MYPETRSVFEAVKAFAQSRQTPTYGDVAKRVGIYHRHVQSHLYLIWTWCDGRGIPRLNAIVVNAQTRLPGGSYTPDNRPLSRERFEKEKLRVFDFDWNSVEFPGRPV